MDSLPNQRIDEPCDYIIVTHDSLYFKDAGQAAIDSLAAHRANFNGFDVAIVTMHTIEYYISGANNTQRILKLIDSTYHLNNANHTYDGKLAYVNLFGDAFFGTSQDDECVPTYLEGYDVFFSQMSDENGYYDDYPDLMIGRCSVDDTEQVQNVVHKILNFKPEDLDYKYDMLTIASSDDFYGTQSNVLMAMDKYCPIIITKSSCSTQGLTYYFPNGIHCCLTGSNRYLIHGKQAKCL